jgi:uncharacterized OB-fold protein
LIFYLVLRPYYTLEEKKLFNIIDNFSRECVNCGYLNYKENVFCVSCGEKLIVKCKECWKNYYRLDDYCPFCGAPNLELEEN